MCSELLMGIQNLQRTVEEVMVGKANTEALSQGKSGNTQDSEGPDALMHGSITQWCE